MVCSCSGGLGFFRTSGGGLNSAYFTRVAHGVAGPGYFPGVFGDSGSPMDSLSGGVWFVGVAGVFRGLLVGGPPRAAASFYSAKLCINSLTKSLRRVMNMTHDRSSRLHLF